MQEEIPKPISASENESPIKNGEVFDAKSEVKKILKSKREDQSKLFTDLREKLEFQLRGLAKMEVEVIAKIRENPDLSARELFKIAKQLGNRYGMNKEQEGKTKRALVEYEEKHKMVQKFRKEYPDDNKLFERLFGKEPIGKIEILSEPMTFYVQCFEPRDYYFACHNADTRKTLEQYEDEVSDGSTAMASGAPDIGSVTLENTGKILKEEDEKGVLESSRQMRNHEERHVITELFDYENDDLIAKILASSAHGGNSENERSVKLQRYIESLRACQDEDTRSEILSFFSQGLQPKEIFDKLALSKKKGGEYDYLFFPDQKNAIRTYIDNEETKERMDKAFGNVYGKEYRELFKESIRGLARLEESGIPRDEIVAILNHVPLRNWPKVAKRVLKNK